MIKKYPEIIPIFPLGGVIYFPKTNLPLNIFEQRYLDLVNDIYNKDKLMGMIQPQRNNNSFFKVGCLGKISDFQKSKDGRIMINLTGITRFEILNEVQNNKLYREFKVDYKKFNKDFSNGSYNEEMGNFMIKAKTFFKKNGLLLNWKEFDNLDNAQKINTLAMIAPITNEEKQKLLEAVTLKDKIETLENIISFYLLGTGLENQTVQ